MPAEAGANRHDRQIAAGEDWAGGIDEHLNSADIITLFVSADFLASDYCYEKELSRALEREERKEALVVPIIVRPWRLERCAVCLSTGCAERREGGYELAEQGRSLD